MKKTILFSFSALLLGATACAGDPPTTLLEKPHKEPGETVGDSVDKPGGKPEDAVAEGNTYDHMNSLGADDARDPLEIAAQHEEEGSPEVRARLHSCQKLQITAIRNILVDFGVDLEATGDPDTAGELLANGGTALGQANYAARMGEDLVWTAAGAAKQFDIFVQAAPEIIAAMPTLPQCQKDGAGVEMFDVSGDGTDVSCNEDAVTCLIGRPATADHLAICKSLIASASTLENGQNIAVATLLSAAHSCE
jgi:hypothetical protein